MGAHRRICRGPARRSGLRFAALDPLDLAGSTGGNPTAASTGGKGTAVLEDAGGEAAPPDAGLIPMPDGSVDAASACWFSTIEPEPAALEVVVDVSSSMNLAPPGGTDSKWNITRDALLRRGG